MTDENTGGEATKKAREGRSPAFPYIHLGRALERVDAFYVAEKTRLSVPIKSIALAWGMGPKSGGAKQTVAALQYYGLVETESKGDRRMVKLSDVAYRILTDNREDTSSKEKLIKQCALSPRVYRELWAKYGSPLPSDATIEYHLIHEMGYKESAVKELISNFKHTIRVANLNETDKIPAQVGDFPLDEEEQGDQDEVSVGDFVQWDSQGVLQFESPRRVVQIHEGGEYLLVEGSDTGILMDEITKTDPPAGPPANPPLNPQTPFVRPGGSKENMIVKEERIIDDAGNPVVIRFTGDIGNMYEFISEYIDFRKKRLSKKD